MSKYYEKVKNYFLQGVWSERMVKNAVGKWITQDECNMILRSKEVQ